MIVVVIGASATGKSTLGEAIADALGWRFIEGDDFHPESNHALMAVGIPLGDKERAPWLEALARSIGDCAIAGTSAVYACSALKRRYRVALLRYAGSPQTVRFVFLHAPRAVLEERLAHRRGHFFPASLLDSQLNDLEPPGDDEPAPTLTVDATRPVEALVAQTLGWLEVTHEPKAGGDRQST
jgi:carbohydrate kinase (thermoresistant glucokinase family)